MTDRIRELLKLIYFINEIFVNDALGVLLFCWYSKILINTDWKDIEEQF